MVETYRAVLQREWLSDTAATGHQGYHAVIILLLSLGTQHIYHYHHCMAGMMEWHMGIIFKSI